MYQRIVKYGRVDLQKSPNEAATEALLHPKRGSFASQKRSNCNALNFNSL